MSNGAATPNALLALNNASNAPNLTLDHCVVVQSFQRVNAPTQLDESMSMQVNRAFPLRHNYQTKHPSHSPSEHYESKMHISR
jgi:hypothetical protein